MPLKIEFINVHLRRYSPSLVALGYQSPELSWGHKNDASNIWFRFDDYEKLYICPLCTIRVMYQDEKFAAFTKEHSIDTEFTKDHYPPQNAGGAATILVCKQCNNKYGHLLEHSIQKHLLSRALAEGNSNIKHSALLELEGLQGRFAMKAKFLEDNKIQCLVPKSNKRVFEFVKRALKNSEPNGYKTKFSFKIKTTPKDAIFSRAILKTAYLFCFATWGYDFVFSVTGEKLREIISGKREHPAKSHGVYFLDKEYLKEEGIYTFQIASGSTFYLVAFNITTKEAGSDHHLIATIIPENSKQAWKGLAMLPNEDKIIDMNVPLYKTPNYLNQGDFFSFKGEGKKFNDFS